MFFRIYRPFLDGVFRFFITFAARKGIDYSVIGTRKKSFDKVINNGNEEQ